MTLETRDTKETTATNIEFFFSRLALVGVSLKLSEKLRLLVFSPTNA